MVVDVVGEETINLKYGDLIHHTDVNYCNGWFCLVYYTGESLGVEISIHSDHDDIIMPWIISHKARYFTVNFLLTPKLWIFALHDTVE